MAGGKGEEVIMGASSEGTDCRNGDVVNGRWGSGMEYGEDLGEGMCLATFAVFAPRNAWDG